MPASGPGPAPVPGKGRFACRRRTSCRICGGTVLVDYLDLGAQPPSNSFPAPDELADEQCFPLQVALCTDCGLSQLRDVVAAEDIFGQYAYLSSTSGALRRHYQSMVDDLLAGYGPPDGAVIGDIGCNDGITLQCYPGGGFDLVGIEPSSAGDYARAAGFDVVPEFFDAALGTRLRAEKGPAALITATNVIAHVDDIGSLFAGVREWLDETGVFVAEFPYLIDMVESCYFDTIYHEHLSYLALTPLARLFAEVGLKAIEVVPQDLGASGPALRLCVARADSSRPVGESIPRMLDHERAWGLCDAARYRDFAARVAALRASLRGMITDLGRAGGVIGAYGAPAKGNTLLNYLALTAEDIVCVSENNALKVGKLTPGTHIPIVDDESFLARGVTHALLLAWNYLDFFLEESDFVRRGGKFIVPLPALAIRP